MNQKIIASVLIGVGVVLSIFVLLSKEREDAYIANYIAVQGSCYLEDGTCLHSDRDYSLYIGGWVLAASLVILGVYLLAFDKANELIARQNESIAGALKEASRKDEFNAFLSGFSDEEQSVLKAIKDQEGIKQSTLRYKAGISKTGLSLMLKDLEERHIISRKQSGKTNEVFLRKKF